MGPRRLARSFFSALRAGGWLGMWGRLLGENRRKLVEITRAEGPYTRGGAIWVKTGEN